MMVGFDLSLQQAFAMAQDNRARSGMGMGFRGF
jgi:hypothetical protein